MSSEAIGTEYWYKESGAFWLVVEEQLPSLNEYVNKCRVNPYAGAQFKKDVDANIRWYIRKCLSKNLLRPIKTAEYPVRLEILWREKTAKRDVDNIKSAVKYILDGLQEAGIIANDSQKYVSQIYDRVEVEKTKASRVFVKIIPNGGT